MVSCNLFKKLWQKKRSGPQTLNFIKSVLSLKRCFQWTWWTQVLEMLITLFFRWPFSSLAPGGFNYSLSSKLAFNVSHSQCFPVSLSHSMSMMFRNKYVIFQQFCRADQVMVFTGVKEGSCEGMKCSWGLDSYKTDIPLEVHRRS